MLFQIEQVIDSAIDEAREIFEYKNDSKNETVEEETSTEEIPEQAGKETDSNFQLQHSVKLANNWRQPIEEGCPPILC